MNVCRAKVTRCDITLECRSPLKTETTTASARENPELVGGTGRLTSALRATSMAATMVFVRIRYTQLNVPSSGTAGKATNRCGRPG